ncbi:MAG: cytochrome ubiquinol oxidase subunit I [Nevskia sp.]
MDAVLLSRIQFGFTIGFHILFPTLTIGLAWFLVAFEARWAAGRRPQYLVLYKFWVKIFALTFGMGVVSGLVLSYEIGTNFSRFSQVAGPVMGPLLSVEVLTAFFVEAGFLGVMLFGWDKVGPRLHFVATLLVAIGTTNSAFWILSANSWMQTPQGAEMIAGRLVPQDWFAVIFNPSFPYRLAHMLLASFITSALVVAGICASLAMRYHRVDDPASWSKRGLRMAIVAIAVFAPLQIVVGDFHGLNVREHQPMKLAAIEAVWQTGHDVPLTLFAIPDQAAQTNRYAVTVPNLGSLILTHSLHGEIKGLNEVPPDQQPPVLPVFFGFRLMVGLGLLFLALGATGLILMWRSRLEQSAWYLRLLVLCTPLGFVATLSGWVVAETGRQPWVVYGVLRTIDAVSPIPASSVAGSLAVFFLVYGLLLGSYVYFVIRLVQKGPALPAKHPEAIRGARAGEILPADA